jgi:hypothetical protein
MSIRAGSRSRRKLHWTKVGFRQFHVSWLRLDWYIHRHWPLLDFQRRVSSRAGSPFRRRVFYAIYYKHSYIRQHRLNRDLHFHDHPWKRHDHRLDYRYRLGLRLNRAVRQVDNTGETGKLYRTAAPWRCRLHSATGIR